jgi:hypothetical protein
VVGRYGRLGTAPTCIYGAIFSCLFRCSANNSLRLDRNGKVYDVLIPYTRLCRNYRPPESSLYGTVYLTGPCLLRQHISYFSVKLRLILTAKHGFTHIGFAAVIPVLLQNVFPQNFLVFKTSFLQNVLPQNVLPQNVPSTKRPCIQNALVYKTSRPQNVLPSKRPSLKTSSPTKRPCLQNALPQNVLPFVIPQNVLF